MIFNLFMVLHGQKGEVLINNNCLQANPPLTETGMIQAQDLIPQLKKWGPYDLAISARLLRCVGMASVVSLGLDIDFTTDSRLGQYGSGGDGKEPVYYPGYEKDGYLAWMENMKSFLRDLEKIFFKYKTSPPQHCGS